MLKNNENGRSMVEMLGVLAIIGVLSVTGILGYTIAMRKYRANEIGQAISMLAIAAKTANGGVGISATANGTNYTDLVENANLPSGVSSLTINPDDGKYKIDLKTLQNPELCQAVAHLFGESTTNPLYVSGNGCSNDVLTIIAK